MLLGAPRERHVLEKGLKLVRIDLEAGEAVPLLPDGDPVLLLELRHLLGCHEAGMIVLVAGERQAKALDGVGDEAVWPVVVDPVWNASRTRSR